MQPKSRKMGHRPSEKPRPLSNQSNAMQWVAASASMPQYILPYYMQVTTVRITTSLPWSDLIELCPCCCQTSSTTTERLLQACPLCDHLWYYFWLAEVRKLFRMSCCAQSLLSIEAVSVWVIDKKRKYCMERLTAQKDVWGCLSLRDTQQSLTLPLSEESKCPK